MFQIQQPYDKIRYLTKKCDLLKKKVKRLNEKVRRRDGKIALFSNIIEDLKKGKFINTEESFILDECAGPEGFLKRQIAKSRGLPLEKKYTEELRKFALTLHFFSPKAYDFIRKTYNTCLPHSRTLSKWYQHVNAEPGFTKEAFESLRRKAAESLHPVVCALTLDEMAIRKCLTWDPKAQKFYGRVDCGHNINSDSVEEASQCLVLLVTCMNGSWKLPIGYFFIVSLTGEQKAVLVRTAIQLCQDAGVKVVSITCDGLAGNFSMFTSLGCNVLKDQTTTKFESHNSFIHAFIDPCHAIKLVRNTFGELRVFNDSMGREINFKYLELLLDLQDQKGLHLATKIGKAHILFEKQKMKVKLATQLFSSSVADALSFCCNNLKIKDFEHCGGTVNFINMMNDVFDILNSHSIRPPGWKKAMCPQNIGLIRALFESASDYINSLKLSSGELVIESRRKTGFIGLIVDMKSALTLYEHLVEGTGMLKYVSLYKISQDHLELFFSAIRARGGFNNNPNAVQFRAAYKKLLIRAEIRDGGIGNCIPLEQINILTCSSKNPVHSINELTSRNDFVKISEDHSDLYDSYIEYLGKNVDEYTESVLEYVAGFVTRKLSRQIKCDLCLSLLIGEENSNTLIFQKTRGGLQYASNGVINIVKKTENLIKPHLSNQEKPENYYLYIFKFLTDYYESEKILFLPHNSEHNTNHRLLLVKSIIKAFIDIRFRYHAKKNSDKVSYRNYLNKLILFRNE